MSQKLTQFKWLNNANNWLFILEDGKKIRTISVDTTPPREIQYANLAEKRVCTCFSWNFDGSQLALVIDERQIYLWDVKLNQFNHYKPTSRDFSGANSGNSNGNGVSSSSNHSGNRKSRSSTICLIAWSMVTNKLVICSSGGQLTICNFSNPLDVTERYIDNGSGLLRQVVRLEPCPHLDLFGCVSETSEVLVMTFDGIAKYYVQADGPNNIKIRFSQPNENSLINVFGDTVNSYIDQQRSKQQQQQRISDYLDNGQASGTRRNFQSMTNGVIKEMRSSSKKLISNSVVSFIWISYQCDEGRLRFKRIVFNFEAPETSSEPDICFDHFDPTQLIASQKQSAQLYDDNDSNSINNELSFFPPRANNIAKLIDHFWINQNCLICCDSMGTIKMLEIKRNDAIKFYPPIVHTLLNIRSDTETILNPFSSQPNSRASPSWPPFKAYDFMLNPKRKKFAKNNVNKSNKQDDDERDDTNILTIAAITSSEIFYYELIWSKNYANDGPQMANKRTTMGDTYYNKDDYYNDIHAFKKSNSMFSLERVDDLDLSSNLQKFQLDLEQVAWSYDCSMLAVQLTGGYTLAYRTHLENYLITRCGPKTAQLSTPTEITVLNFQVNSDQMSTSAIASPASLRTTSSASSSNNNNNTNQSGSIGCKSKQALVVNVYMRPSIMAIGPCHLAVGLNNRARLYQTTNMPDSRDKPDIADMESGPYNQQQHQHLLEEAKLISELDYSSIVCEIELNSKYIATLFMDGRLKLSSIPISKIASSMMQADDVRERTFPDPGQRFERISCFCLTEENFLYFSEQSLKLQVFCLRQWSVVQLCDLSKDISNPIIRLRANEQGNKFVCLLKTNINDSSGLRSENEVFLYDLNSNKFIKINHQQQQHHRLSLFKKIMQSQIESVNLCGSDGLLHLEENRAFRTKIMKFILNSASFKVVRFGKIEDAIWDTDGRNLILVEHRLLHNIAILDHTIDSTTTSDCGISIEHVASLSKPYNNEPVYMTQGVVSYQTKLGRMINSILYLHDDDLRLVNLERVIAEIQLRINEEEAYYEEISINKQQQRQQRAQISVKNESNEDNDTNINDENESKTDTDTTQQNSQIEYSEKFSNEIHENLRSLYSRAKLELVRLKVSYLLTILPIYSINRCKCILEHLATDEQFNLTPPKTIAAIDTAFDNNYDGSILLWRILAAWSIYTMNLNFALMVYRKCKLMTHARWLTNLMKELRVRDSMQSTRVRLLNELLELPNDDTINKRKN